MSHHKIIDIHNHPNWLNKTVDELVKNMDELGIEKTWLLSWEIPEKDCWPDSLLTCVTLDPRASDIPLWLVVEALKAYPDRFIGGWAPNPKDMHARGKLKAAVSMYNIKVVGELKFRIRYDDPDAIALYKLAGELGLPVLFHLECSPTLPSNHAKDITSWRAWYGGDMEVVENMCKLCPQTKFIGHGPGFWWEISADEDEKKAGYPKGKIKEGGKLIEVLRRYPNLYCDISAGSGANALSRDPEFARSFVLEFQDRIMLGRDSHGREHLDILEQLDLPEDVMKKVLAENAEKILEK